MALRKIEEASQLQESAVPAIVFNAFRRLDENGDGMVDRAELSRVLQALDPASFTDVQVNHLMAEVDTNRDGRIQLHEFLEWIFASGEDQRLFCSSMGLAPQAGELELQPVGGKPGAPFEPRDYNQYRLQPISEIPSVPAGGYVGALAKKAPVGLLRQELGRAMSVPAESLLLAHAGQDLDDAKTLRDNGVLEPGAAARRRGARVDLSFQVRAEVVAEAAQRVEELEREAQTEAEIEQRRLEADRLAAEKLAEEERVAEERRRVQFQEEDARRERRQEAARRAEDRQMPSLGFRRLMTEFRKVQRAVASGELPWVLECQPVDDNMLEWKVDLTFPPESPLQQGLINLAESVFDQSRDRVSLQVRFQPEYPRAPPEVWLKQPRLRYQSGVPVTFGGKMCNHLLTSAGWDAATSMGVVLTELRQSLLDSGAEVDMAVSVKRPEAYLTAPSEISRLRTEQFPLANAFVKDGMTALSTRAAEAFLGDLSRLEASDKVGLPFEFAEELYGRAARGEALDLPLMFELKTRLGRKTHCAIYDFLQGLPLDTVLMPFWLMEELSIEERAQVRVRSVALSLISFVRVQPHSVDFYRAVRDSGQEVGPLLTESLARFSALTEDSSVPIEIAEEMYKVQIVELRPHAAVRIIDSDVRHTFEFEVDFEPSPDLEDEAAREEREQQLLAHARQRREAKEALQRTVAEQLADARRRRFQKLREQTRAAAGAVDGGEGDVDLAVRMPDGTQLKGSFPEGAPVAAVAAFALGSPWAERCLPWGIHLLVPFPRRLLPADSAIARDLHRSAISVQEEREPADAEDLLRHAVAEAAMPGDEAQAVGDAAALPVPPPELDEAAAQRRTERAFEIQRFIQAGVDPEEAAHRCDAGERLGLTAGQRAAAEAARPRPPLAARLPAAPAAPAVPEPEGEEERRGQQIRDVMGVTGVEHERATQTLEQAAWDVARAVNMLLDEAM